MSRIAFNKIPADLRTPGALAEVDNSAAVETVGNTPYKILLVGVALSSGTGPKGVVEQVFSEDDGQQWGRGGMLERMVYLWKQAAPFVPCYVVALAEDAGGTAATYTVTFAGTATAAGNFAIYVGSHRIPVALTGTEDDDAQGTAFKAACDARPELPFTCSAPASGVCTLTMKWKGESGNDMPLRLNIGARERLPAGVTAPVFAAGVTGADDPDVAGMIAAITGRQFTHIACPFRESANLSALAAELLTRGDPQDQKWGVAFTSFTDSASNAITFGEAGNDHNRVSPHHAANTQNGDYENTAIWACVCASEPDPARPMQTLPLRGMLAYEADRALSYTEGWTGQNEQLLRSGIATAEIGEAGEYKISRVVTGYRVNPQGAADRSLSDLTSVLTAYVLRDRINGRLRLAFPRHKLADDGNEGPPYVVTPSLARAQILEEAILMQEDGLIENIDDFSANLIVERSTTDKSRLNWSVGPDLVNGLRVMAGIVKFKL